MWDKLHFIESELMKVHTEIRTTKDRMRLMELGIIRAWLKLKEVELLDELDDEARENLGDLA